MAVGIKRLGSRADETLWENLERFTALGLDERDDDENQEREERRHKRVDASEILESLLFAGVRIPSVRGSLVNYFQMLSLRTSIFHTERVISLMITFYYLFIRSSHLPTAALSSNFG